MKTKKVTTKKDLLQFTISKKEALSLEGGGPIGDRGTVSTPATSPPGIF